MINIEDVDFDFIDYNGLKSLQKTGDHYPKYLLIFDMDKEADYNGITKINIIDWLLNKE